jgi:hypothetical protein
MTAISFTRVLVAFLAIATVAYLSGCENFFNRPDESGPIYVPPPDPPTPPPPDPPTPVQQ